MKKIIMAEYDEYNSQFKLGEHHYAKLFSQNGFKVLWLNPIYNNLIYIKRKNLYEKRKKLNRSPFIELDKGIYSYSPYSLFLYGNQPIFNTKFACRLSNKLILPNFKRTLKENNFDDVDILWLSNPKYFYLKDILNYKKLYYRCADDVPNNNNLPKSIKYFEKTIFKEADKVFVTSKNIIEKRKNERNDLIYLPNGVEVNNFIRNKYDIPKEFEANRKKKCIYVGAIKEWFDVDLLDYISDKLNDIEFYIIGPIDANVQIIKDKVNIHFLGKIDYKYIPNYMYYSDVGIIPFKVNSFIDGVSPIKLYEYMSTGLNVVSTDFEGIRLLNSSAYLAKDYEEFCRYIEQAIENKEKNMEKNTQFAKENTWGKRFENIILKVFEDERK